MQHQARPQDLLLAYDPDFTGYTSLKGLAQPLERAGDLAFPPPPEGVLGGTEDPDGYCDDFMTRLDRFVREFPRLGPRSRGLGAERGPLDWKALVVSLDGDGSASDEEAPASDGEAPAWGSAGHEEALGSEEAESDEESEGGASGGAWGRGDGAPALVSLGEFVVEVGGGRRPGEMDESAYEGSTFGGFEVGEPGESEEASEPSEPEEASEPEERPPGVSILDYAAPARASILDYAAGP